MIATGNSVLRAYNKAAKKIQQRTMSGGDVLESTEAAGLIFPPGQKRGHKEGYQVFVTVSRYSDALLKEQPDSGGLLVNTNRAKLSR